MNLKINGIYSILINKIIAIKKNRWVFMSFSGHYSDSPKYVSIKLHELHPEIEIVWCVSKQYIELLPDYVTGVEIGTKEAAEYLASAEIIFDNIYGNRAFTVFGSSLLNRIKAKLLQIGYRKKGQRIYSTWHGTPLKRMGRDQIGNDVSDLLCENLQMIFGNTFTKNIMAHMTYNKIPMNLIGTPRNDLLFHSNVKYEYFKKKLKLPLDKRIILFAPTFRNDGKDCENKNLLRSGINQIETLDFVNLFQILSEKFGGDWCMVCRFHYHVAEMVDWNELAQKYNNRIINGNEYDDMSEYLVSSDILLTDASSCMFDFALTGRPCFLFFPDLNNYAGKERGFYIPIESLPFPVSTTFEDFINSISNFNESTYKKDLDSMMINLGYCETGKASEDIVEYIIQDIKK